MQTTFDMFIICFQLISISSLGYLVKTTNSLYEKSLTLFYLLIYKELIHKHLIKLSIQTNRSFDMKLQGLQNYISKSLKQPKFNIKKPGTFLLSLKRGKINKFRVWMIIQNLNQIGKIGG
jgi:hypothetical protein